VGLINPLTTDVVKPIMRLHDETSSSRKQEGGGGCMG